MATMDMRKAREEFLTFLRNSDILSTTQRGVTTISDNFTATLSQTIFSLNSVNARNIRTVTVDSVAKNVYGEYAPGYNVGTSSTVTFVTGVALSSDVSILYDYSSGTTEKVWPDYPDILFLPATTPRVGFDFISMRTKPIGIGTVNWLTDALVRTKFYSLGAYLPIDEFITTFRAALKAAQKKFYHFKIAHVGDMSPVNPTVVGKTGKVLERSVDTVLQFNFES